MRLHKFIAACGVCSRRKAETLIKDGGVRLNGAAVFDMGVVIDPETDVVEVLGSVIALPTESPKTYLLLNKPVGYISSSDDQFGRKTVLDLIPRDRRGASGRLFSVGRLDYDTSGLIILTDDGDFAYKLTHPKFELPKRYVAVTDRAPGKDAIKSFSGGLLIDGRKTSTAGLEVYIADEKTGRARLVITIKEGRNRQVRKMCAAIGLTVLSLTREGIGDLTLDGLNIGCFRELNDKEVKTLLNSCSMETNG